MGVATATGLDHAEVSSPVTGGGEDGAATKLQKVYRSYRTRRKLADTAVVVEELWWQALDYARLSYSTISFFHDPNKPETVASRWSRVSLIASKDGQGLSRDAKARKLAFQHWIEAIDPRHRYGHNLHCYYDVWCQSQAGQPFFYWLDIGEGKDVDLPECPRARLKKQCIKYLGPKEREQYEYIITEGKIIHKCSEEPLDTSQGSKWIFVMSTTKRLYAGKKEKGVFQHSSFLAGGATIAAGRFTAENGIIKVWTAIALVMALSYVKLSMFGTAAAYSKDDEIMAAVAVLTQTPKKRPWGGSMPGHKTYKRHRIAADWQLNQDYFVERPLYNEEHFRRSGHYKQSAENLSNFMNFLEENGVDLNNVVRPSDDDAWYEESVPNKVQSPITAIMESNPPQLILPQNMVLENKASGSSSQVEGADEGDNAATEQAKPTYQRTLSGGLQSPRAAVDVPRKAILERVKSKRESRSYQLGHKLSLIWSTGAGPRIGCVNDYPMQLRMQAPEMVNLSPRASAPSTSWRLQESLSLSPNLPASPVLTPTQMAAPTKLEPAMSI